MRKHREELIKKLNDLVKDDPRIGSAKKALSIGAEHPQPIKEALDAKIKEILTKSDERSDLLRQAKKEKVDTHSNSGNEGFKHWPPPPRQADRSDFDRQGFFTHTYSHSSVFESRGRIIERTVTVEESWSNTSYRS